ncbi:MAG: alanine--glyoxylate aminotransferase family protein [candidate division WOR-3 bacterium]|nr:alanine--glyoxylate aminotransferase family protein [candidate division WOR-3 bacterium]
MHKKLFIPGPTEVRDDILQAQAKPMIGHRSKEFSALYEGIVNKIKQALNTKNYVIVFTSSGTGIMEGAIRNCVYKDVLCCVNGAFSDRWFKIAKACGKNADAITVEWGKAIKPEMIEEKLKQKKYDAVTLVHNESSTGVRAPLEEIAEVMKKYPDTFWLVDTVSSLMGDKIEIDKLGIDVCLASVQKCFALPPGLAVCTVTERALERTRTITDRGYYFDFDAMLKRYEKDRQTPTTPAVTLMYALDKQMDKILAEGMENRYKRHLEMAKYVREWAKKYFALFPEPGYESVTLTCVDNTRKITVADLNSELGKRGFQISNGYGDLKEKTFRIAHMGDLTLDEIKELIDNINDILKL